MMLEGYNLDEIYNADKFRFQYRLASNKTIATTQPSGSKKDNERINCLTSCKARGSDMVRLWIIGNAPSPPEFWAKSGEELIFDYRINAQAWMPKFLS